MADIRIPDDLWDTAEVPEGVVANWFFTNGGQVPKGATVAEITVEKTSFDIESPEGGRLKIVVPKDGIVLPGTVIGQIENG